MDMKRNRWLLPEGIEEVLPPDATQLDALCRAFVDQFRSWGYELVMPPLIEYLESLLTGTGEDLELQTFKITDQLTGRMMGIRADTTPQVARIDAHFLKRETPARLCYLGTVLHTRPTGPGGTRAPLQVGAELYGHAGRESDAEILALMLRTLETAGIANVHVDLGHVGIYRGLVRRLELNAEQESTLFQSLQKKSRAELEEEIGSWSLPAGAAAMLLALVDLHGGPSVLAEARSTLRQAGPDVIACIDELEQTAALAARQVRTAPLYFDLSELRGYRYYTGVTYAAFSNAQGQGIAFGGRYDDIGRAFGRARPATGFSSDVKLLYATAGAIAPPRRAVFAPSSEVPGLYEAVEALRKQGEIVISALPGQSGDARAMGCDRELVLEGGRWTVRALGGRTQA